MTVEGWKSVFDWGTVILLFLTFAFGAGALITGGILSKHQEQKSRRFEKDLTEAKTKLVEQQERTAVADSRVASLETDAANAKAEMAKQQTRAANAERALLELQQSLADRDITPQQRDKMLKVLRGKPAGHVVVQSLVTGGREAMQYAGKIAAVFSDAGWNVEPPNGRGMFGAPISGVFLVAGSNTPTELTNLFVEVLVAGGIAKAPVGVSPSPNTPTGTLEIWVAGKSK
jgi:hypothetical protein